MDVVNLDDAWFTRGTGYLFEHGRYVFVMTTPEDHGPVLPVRSLDFMRDWQIDVFPVLELHTGELDSPVAKVQQRGGTLIVTLVDPTHPASGDAPKRVGQVSDAFTFLSRQLP